MPDGASGAPGAGLVGACVAFSGVPGASEGSPPGRAASGCGRDVVWAAGVYVELVGTDPADRVAAGRARCVWPGGRRAGRDGRGWSGCVWLAEVRVAGDRGGRAGTDWVGRGAFGLVGLEAAGWDAFGWPRCVWPGIVGRAGTDWVGRGAFGLVGMDSAGRDASGWPGYVGLAGVRRAFGFELERI